MKPSLEMLKDKKIVSYMVLGIAIFLIDVFLVIRPLTESISKINPKIKKISSDMRALKDDQKNIEQLKKSLEAIRKKSRDLDKCIIQEDELISVIEAISKIGREQNLKINQISPVEEAKPKKIGTFSKGDIYPIMINMTVSSSYHNLGKFINRIENLDEFLKVVSLEVKFDKLVYTSQAVHIVLGAFIVKQK